MHLLNKYMVNTSLPFEKDALFEMLSDPDYKDTLNQKMKKSWNFPSAEVNSSSLSSSDWYLKINERKSAHLNVSKSTKTNMKWYCVAASFSSGIGERKYMVLTDSNEIWLNSDSTIRFPDDFSFNEVAAASLASWKEGNLMFENITFGEAVVTLQKPFGVRFLFDNDTHKV